MKIILFANTDWFLHNFCSSLTDTLIKKGNIVRLYSSTGEYSRHLLACGYDWLPLSMSQHGINPLAELAALVRIIKAYKQAKPDLVQHYTVKCVLYGSIAARILHIPHIVNIIPGLGYIFTDPAFKARFLRPFISLLYRLVLQPTTVVFLNQDDKEYFLDHRLIDASQAVVISSTGVDTARFAPLPEPLEQSPVVVLPGRMLWTKGIQEFVQAAELLHQQGVAVRFALVGSTDPGNPASIPEEQLSAWEQSGAVEWWRFRGDMAEVYRQALIVCVPSLGREGVPATLLEGAASQRALIASDIPGCREVVLDGKTGLLVEPGCADGLAGAVRKLIENPELRKELAANGRQRVEALFTNETVVRQTLALHDRMMKR
ncbi:MAG TPA: glycosyltransferase family 4 protein [Longilinea sp.]|nr:glycosyltransferase family 4 protein [Longilinea sp.]